MRTTFPFPFASSVVLLALLLIAMASSLLVSSKSGEALGQANEAIGRKSTLPVIHRRSSSEERRNNERVTFIQSKKLPSGNQAPLFKKVSLPVYSGDRFKTGNYVVNISLGSQEKVLTVALDTGSDLTWTRCARSDSSPPDQIFDPSQSSSYKNVSFNSDDCRNIISGTSDRPQDKSSTCYYGNEYADKSYTHGFFAKETLTLSSPTDKKKDFRFGCGQEIKGQFFGQVAGIMGLGRDNISIVKQTAAKYGGNFSYCLPAKEGSHGFLILGRDEGPPASFTEMLKLPNKSYYGIKLVAISVDEKPLPISKDVFQNAGFVIDSGTVITRLPKTAYDELQKAFIKAMISHGYQQVVPPRNSSLKICYDKRKIKTIPSVTFTFGGDVKVNLTKRNILYTVGKCECLAFRGNDNDSSLGIYGNQQQLTFEVIHDLPGNQIGFVHRRC
ncbi:hypothetical protein MLD38_015206 [Melastoma candidum]|uniref:Uncharacterized protein n=1 Tax=Melastoma candidum TaxID=119954 RepID=A0ACB9RH89_9MYRT|nr:hypothetical protein MLD38_015206 [Melastoma candidum]